MNEKMNNAKSEEEFIEKLRNILRKLE